MADNKTSKRKRLTNYLSAKSKADGAKALRACPNSPMHGKR